jgi:hypothetical protein
MSAHVLRQYFGPQKGQEILDIVKNAGCQLSDRPEPKKKGLVLLHMRLAGVNAGGCTKDRVPVEVDPKNFEATRANVGHAVRQVRKLGRPHVAA